MLHEPGSWAPGCLVELWGGTVVFYDEDAFEDPSVELRSAVAGSTLGTVMSSTVLRCSTDVGGLGKQAYVLLLVGHAVGWVNARSVRRTLDEGHR